MILLCLDFEASGRGPRCYPIEVAVADVATGDTRAWLIAPTPAWLETGLWEAEAEAVHGIGRAELIAHGRGVRDVAAELTAHTRGAQVLSDAPAFDTKWLCDLYRATGAEPPFVLRDFHQIAWHEGLLRGRRPDIAIVKAEAEAYILFPQQHRAGPDARRNAEMLRQIQRAFADRQKGEQSPMTDNPPLFGEDWYSARLLEIVCRYCGAAGDELDSGAIPAHADLMRLCAENGDIEITAERDGRIFAVLTPEGRALRVIAAAAFQRSRRNREKRPQFQAQTAPRVSRYSRFWRQGE